MKCENCDKEHDGSYGSGRFCSSKCARGFSTKSKRQEINEKVSEKLKGKIGGVVKAHENVVLKCKKCNRSFEVKWKCRKNRQFCCNSCSVSYRYLDKEYTRKASERSKKLMEQGVLTPWRSRKGLKPSYPEKFFIRVFETNGIGFEREVKLDRYFADFLIDKNLVIEIDGSQHERADRKKSDQRKDRVLKKMGYRVHRIRWKNPVNHHNKKYIEQEIKILLEMII